MKNLKRVKLFSSLIVAITISMLLVGVLPVQAAGTKDISLKVALKSTTLLTAGSLDPASVVLKSVPPGTSYNSYDVVVKADAAVLSAQRIVVGTALPGAAISTICVNGSGIGCTTNDGPGIAHLAVHSLSNGLNGTLFKVVYKALNGVGAFGSVGTVVDITCFTFAASGIPIAPTRFTVLSANYASVPAAALPTATIASNVTSITIKATTKHNVTITATGINGLSSAITFSDTVTGALTAHFATTPVVVSCDCGAKPAVQLTILPSAAGTFTVTVTAVIHGPALTTPKIASIVITVNAV